MIPRCAPPPAVFSSPIPQRKTIRPPSAAVPSSPVSHFVSPISFSSVHRRLPLLLLLLAFLLFVSLAINVFFGAQFLFGNGTFQSFGGCSQFSFSNWHRPKRQIGEKEGGLLAKMEYMWNKPSKHTKFVVGTEEESEVPLFVPLYTQLPQKYLSEICHQRFHKKQLELVEKNKESSDDTETNRTKQRKTTSRDKGHRRKKYREKICPPIGSFAAPRLVARRMHRQGAAMRRGERWFLTEYDNGYTLFQFELNNIGTESAKKQHQFTDARMNNASDAQWQWDFPSHIVTLPEPFRGTDHSVGGAEGNETFFYQSASEEQRIQAVHLGTGKRISKLIYAAKYPLYGASVSPPLLPPANSVADDHQQLDDDQLESVFGSSASLSSSSFSSSSSSVDLEVDQSALWVLFRRPNLSDSSGRPLPHLTVLKLTLDSMKELAQWDLTQTNADQMVNAFVACAQLFAVVKTKRPQQTKWEGSNAPPLQIVPLFDFRSSKSLSGTALPISAPGWTAAKPNSISNVQYDAISDSLMVFDGGKVYIIKIQRGKGSP